jgi:TolB-like protein/class 3 adenylate cyclase/Tfp pilus assembly protein PilF
MLRGPRGGNLLTVNIERKLAAILAADCVGYSRLIAADDEGTLRRLNEHRRDLIDPAIGKHRGRIVKTTGDGFLAEFASVVDAVRCAVEVQIDMAERNAGESGGTRLEFRIGINVGDVVEQDGDIFGDGVNIAARLEAFAEPGGICVSERVREDVGGRIGLAFEDIGEQSLKNIPRPVRVFRLRPAPSLAATALGPPSLPEKPSIAVLPFQNMSGDQEQDYFGDGIAEDIITALSRLRGFFVIARNSTFAYKGKTPDVRQVARDLGVRYVLEGSVRKAGERLRVSAQLIDATTGAHVWAERYDRGIADIFAVQDEITQSVVASIEPQVYSAEGQRLRSRPTESLDAWGCVTRAMPYVWTWAVADNKTGVALLERALEIDPGYARATSLLAWSYGARAQLGWSEPSEVLEKALEFARHAIEQDLEDPWAHLAAGYVHMVSRRYQPALNELKESIERNPSFAHAHMLLGSVYGYGGAVDDGLREVAIAERLSPRDHNQAANLSVAGLCHFMAGRYAEGVDFERRAVQLRPYFGTAWRTLAASAGQAGEMDVAAEALAKCKELQPSLSLDWIEKYHPIVRAEDRARYIEGLRRAGLQ